MLLFCVENYGCVSCLARFLSPKGKMINILIKLKFSDHSLPEFYIVKEGKYKNSEY